MLVVRLLDPLRTLALGSYRLAMKIEKSELARRAAMRAISSCLLACIVMLLACCSGSGAAGQKTDPSSPVVVGVAKVTRQDLSRTLSIAAEFRPFQDIEIDAKVAGYVKSIYVDIGDHVKTGQLLAVLEIPELQDQVTQAIATVSESEQEIQHAQFELAQSKATYQSTHLQYTRMAQVMKTQPNLIAQQEIDDALSKDQAAGASVDAAKAALATANEQLAVAKANQDRVQALYSYSRITAPFTGVITQRYADTGAMLQAGTSSHTQAMPLVQLSQNDLLRLTIPVPESAVPFVHVGMPAQVEVLALNKTYTGKVARFADNVDFATRTMRTEIDVSNPKLELIPGMYAQASLVLERRTQVLVVPTQALDRQGNQASVLVVNAQSQLQRVPVQLGLERPDRIEVVSGLREGDLVVVSDRSQLREGETVQPKTMNLVQGDS